MFHDYYSARMHFQSKKKSLDEKTLRQMIHLLKGMGEKAIFLQDKIQFADLILDIEDYMDSFTNMDLLLHTRRQECDPETRRKKVEFEKMQKKGTNHFASRRNINIKEDQEATIKFTLGDNETDLFNRIEKEIIIAALDYFEGNRTRVARMVGLSVRGLRNRLESYNLHTRVRMS